ncbi:hypothetical protein F4678DRAFT_193732 [Xylaria arbuscula]|nr:hypothetical protein F4678DRAFT_193732 [Xylaria arbuscula]
MSRLWSSAIFEIPIALVRKFLALFYYMFVYLFSIAASIQHYVFRNQTTNLICNSVGLLIHGFHRSFILAYRFFTFRTNQVETHYNRPTFNQTDNAEQAEELLKLYRIGRTRPVVFIAIAVAVSTENSEEIRDIGLSIWHWCLHSSIESYHWEIINPHLLKDHYEENRKKGIESTKRFEFGQLYPVMESKLAKALDETLGVFTGYHGSLCIVGHGIHNLLICLQPYWSIPNGAIVLDTEKILQHRHSSPSPASLEHCIRTTPSLEKMHKTLGNSGNDARCTMRLMQALAEMSWRKTPM